jgi:prepilin-type N-terminal cleavage/methylation domain-containing protein
VKSTFSATALTARLAARGNDADIGSWNLWELVGLSPDNLLPQSAESCRERGFTLIEMLVVMMIIGLFVGLVSVITRPDIAPYSAWRPIACRSFLGWPLRKRG